MMPTKLTFGHEVGIPQADEDAPQVLQMLFPGCAINCKVIYVHLAEVTKDIIHRSLECIM